MTSLWIVYRLHIEAEIVLILVGHPLSDGFVPALIAHVQVLALGVRIHFVPFILVGPFI